MRLSLFAVLFSLGLCAFAPAWAQNAVASLDDDLSVDFEQAFDAIDNPYLADSIKLHYQITLLEKMTARQAELLKISDSFKALGIPFEEPPPSYTLCAQLPPNTPCLRHYPRLYQDVVESRQRHYSQLAAEQAVSSGAALPTNPITGEVDPEIAERARKEREAQEARAKEERLRAAAAERQGRYRWSEVTCVAGQCSGVISGAQNVSFRSTVRPGSRLPDGTMVETVSRSGIGVIIDGDRIQLRPVPAEQGTGGGSLDLSATGVAEFVPTGGGNNVSIVNASPASTDSINMNDAAAAPAQPQTVAAQGATTAANPVAISNNAGNGSGGDAQGGGMTMVEPALGPSGLF